MSLLKRLRSWTPVPIKKAYRRYLRRRLFSYPKMWNYLALQDPMDAILTGVSDEAEFNRKGEADAKWLLEIIGPDKVVLDLGCGLGRIEKYLASSCRQLHAADVSKEMLNLAADRLRDVPNIVFHRVNGNSLAGFPDEMFDAVFSLLVLQHVEREDAYRYILEFHRVLRDGGKCILQFPNLLSERCAIFCRTFARFLSGDPTGTSVFPR